MEKLQRIPKGRYIPTNPRKRVKEIMQTPVRGGVFLEGASSVRAALDLARTRILQTKLTSKQMEQLEAGLMIQKGERYKKLTYHFDPTVSFPSSLNFPVEQSLKDPDFVKVQFDFGIFHFEVVKVPKQGSEIPVFYVDVLYDQELYSVSGDPTISILTELAGSCRLAEILGNEPRCLSFMEFFLLMDGPKRFPDNFFGRWQERRRLLTTLNEIIPPFQRAFGFSPTSIRRLWKTLCKKREVTLYDSPSEELDKKNEDGLKLKISSVTPNSLSIELQRSSDVPWHTNEHAEFIESQSLAFVKEVLGPYQFLFME